MPRAEPIRAALARVRARLAACDRYDLAVAALLIALLALALTTYNSYAISNDEEVQQRYGELIVAYYASGFTDQALFHYANLYLYGGLFDVFAVLAERLLPFFDPYSIRHVLCALTGIAGIGAAWATARFVAGPRAGAIAALALAVCGPWYGSMFNHTKDVPFAAAMMGATYFLLRATRDLPRPHLRHVIAFGLLLGAALGIRALGLLMIGYACLAMLMRIPRPRIGPMRDSLNFFAQSVIALAPAFLIGYVIMIAAWPWSALAPLNPVRGLLDLGEFNYHIKTLLDGHIYEMGDVPRWYVQVYLLIKLPLLVLAGAAAAFAFIVRPGSAAARTPDRRSETALLAFIATFPVICEVIDRGPAFTGLRHFLFVVPTFAVLAGLGFDWLLTEIETHGRALATTALAAIGAVLLWNAAILVELHPLSVSLLQSAGRRTGGSVGALRHRLLGQHHAGGGRRSRRLCRQARPDRRTRPPLHRGGLRRAAAVREGSRRAPAMDRGLEEGGLLHCADPHELRPRARRHGDRDHYTAGRAHRRGQRPPCFGAIGNCPPSLGCCLMNGQESIHGNGRPMFIFEVKRTSRRLVGNSAYDQSGHIKRAEKC